MQNLRANHLRLTSSHIYRSVIIGLLVVGCGPTKKVKGVGWPPPEAADMSQKSSDALSEVSQLPAETIAIKTSACEELIERSCEYYGKFSDSCISARHLLDKRPEQSLCRDILDRQQELTDFSGNPCWRYAHR